MSLFSQMFGRNLSFWPPLAKILIGSWSSWIIQPSLKISWSNSKYGAQIKGLKGAIPSYRSTKKPFPLGPLVSNAQFAG
ncbi:hypothetical protein RchiOBHm_Chr4g0397191 [Rosa chinensis]|uniref:Uncharacterized protein n=1 Tax=Rosa chinensis TaxID=74649 RepID=A0A2P6QRZ8_ROSCH|nr:hypothetical protein RchiOBHm_Chr4g0397191 [Rosa chinensis]